MKDYHDLLLLIRQHKLVDSKKLKEATQRTFTNRETTLRITSLIIQTSKFSSNFGQLTFMH